MKIIWFILVLLGSYGIMEFVAWFAHKHIMHGFGWFLHADHHARNPSAPKGFFEKNDAFFVIFALPAMAAFIAGAFLARPLLLAAGTGITLYGLTYFLIHDVLFHQRIPWRMKGNAYVRALRRAHGQHHVHSDRHDGECFGLLVFPLRYLRMETKRS
ncbi:MAG: sterol desaturase family protein [Bacteroidales bacterium]